LALGVGRVDVDQMLEEIPSTLLVEWMAFFEIEPWGYDAANWRSGIVSATVANVKRKPGTKAFYPADFMPVRKQQQSPAEMIAALKSFG
jgi:hypothetical protein